MDKQEEYLESIQVPCDICRHIKCDGFCNNDKGVVMDRGKRHSQADTTIRKTSGRISEARQNGRKPQDPDIKERGDAITTRADIQEARRQKKIT